MVRKHVTSRKVHRRQACDRASNAACTNDTVAAGTLTVTFGMVTVAADRLTVDLRERGGHVVDEERGRRVAGLTRPARDRRAVGRRDLGAVGRRDLGAVRRRDRRAVRGRNLRGAPEDRAHRRDVTGSAATGGMYGVSSTGGMYGVSSIGGMYGVSSMGSTPGMSIEYSTGAASAPIGGRGTVNGPRVKVVGGGAQLAATTASTPTPISRPIRTRPSPDPVVALFMAPPSILVCLFGTVAAV